MRKLILYTVLCCLMAAGANAQSTKALTDTGKLIKRDVIKLIANKKLSANCVNPFKGYDSLLNRTDTPVVTPVTLPMVLAANQGIIQKAAEKTFNNACKDKSITSIISRIKTWTTALQVYSKLIPKTDTTLINIKVIKAGDGSMLTPAVTVDTSHKQRYELKATADTSGNLKVTIIHETKADNKVYDGTKNPPTVTLKIDAPAASQSGGNHTLIWILLIILVVLTACVAYLTNRLKNLKSTHTNVTPVNISLNASTENTQAAIVQPQVIIQATTTHAGNQEKYFDCELMMTAGPRKKPMSDPNADTDLGEDVCGFVQRKDTVLFWLLDGTSDLHFAKDPVTNQEYFSSRLLAQSIAGKLKNLTRQDNHMPLNQVLLKAIEDVRVTWLTAINALPQSEKDILKANIIQDKFMECATTVIVATINLNGSLTAYRSGDSKVFLYATEAGLLKPVKSTLNKKNDDSNDRIFFRLLLIDDEFDLVFNQPLFEIVEASGISTAIATSDGVGKLTEKTLKQEQAADGNALRTAIITQFQGTADDKSLCFIEIKEN